MLQKENSNIMEINGDFHVWPKNSCSRLDIFHRRGEEHIIKKKRGKPTKTNIKNNIEY